MKDLKKYLMKYGLLAVLMSVSFAFITIETGDPSSPEEYPDCACGHHYTKHDMKKGKEPCKVSGCDCTMYEADW